MEAELERLHGNNSGLGAIQNMAELLLEGTDLSGAARRRLIENIQALAHRLIELVSRMLDLARLEAGKIELEMIELRVSDVVRQSLDVLRFSASVKDITMQLVIEPDQQLVQADWMKLSQILNNLLTNAIKFTHAGGQVVITVGPSSAGMRVSVADSGLGIPPEQLPYVFEKLRQVHAQGTASECGNGLGLAIVRQLVELHGGSITVSSELRRGSTFTFDLPSNELAVSVSV